MIDILVRRRSKLGVARPCWSIDAQALEGVVQVEPYAAICVLQLANQSSVECKPLRKELREGGLCLHGPHGQASDHNAANISLCGPHNGRVKSLKNT